MSSTAAPSPSIRAVTEPSASFLTHPARPRAWAASRAKARKATPWTRPVMWAVMAVGAGMAMLRSGLAAFKHIKRGQASPAPHASY